MLRVYGTIQNSRFGEEMDDELEDLEDWVKEIHESVYRRYFVSPLRCFYAPRLTLYIG